MSAKKRREPRPFLGHQLTHSDVRTLASLIGYTANLVGLSKRKIKSEEELWGAVEMIYGLRPEPDEPFITALRRITGTIRAKTGMQRKMARKAAGVSGTNKGKKPNKAKKAKASKPSKESRESFYKSWEWRELRMVVLKKYGRRCMCCGATPDDVAIDGSPVRIVVDHIKPLSLHWELRLSPNNLQVLCDECNMGKGAWDSTDYRPDANVLAFPSEQAA